MLERLMWQVLKMAPGNSQQETEALHPTGQKACILTTTWKQIVPQEINEIISQSLVIP